FGFAENTDDLFVGKTLLHGDVLMWLMKTLLTSGCTNQRGAGQSVLIVMLVRRGEAFCKRPIPLFLLPSLLVL
ncbi:hypothetical protein, partial [Enterobacter hormaechei]|uniref:hypothetical protein n=1 Tax=Enterobacter hormaechei TaxID=158836 RepID=UPI001AEDB011